jgi:hypothetical protein
MEELLKMQWNTYCENYETDTLFFYDAVTGKFIIIAEGTGDNLTCEDAEDGYTAYWNCEVYTRAQGNCGGGMLLLENGIDENGETVGEIIAFLEENASEFDGVEGISLSASLLDPEEGENLECEFQQAEMEKFRKGGIAS